ncbi:MAG: FkbM family methyltransferase, partial [Desulfovibrio sp.]|nr:FkbM family methyltransferase [Desulfovibrio sp.]
MSADLTDLFMLQLAQQASLYDLSFMKDRRRSSERVAAFFLKTLELLPVSVCMEIGAHEATFSRKAKNARPDIIARAFEANPHVYAHFMFDKELGELGVDYRHRAVGNVNGVTEFHIYESVMGQPEPVDSRRQSCLLRADSPEASHYAIKAPIATLDAVCARDGEDARYALWIDAEGFGKQVLDGAKSVLDRTLAIYIELVSIGKFDGQALDREIISFLLERDFIPILRDFQFNHQYNVIFVKKGSMPLVEHEWHRYFQAVLRKEFSNIFGV